MSYGTLTSFLEDELHHFFKEINIYMFTDQPIRHLYQLRCRDNPKKDCSNSADIGIGYCSTRRILSSYSCDASIPFANESLPDSVSVCVCVYIYIVCLCLCLCVYLPGYFKYIDQCKRQIKQSKTRDMGYNEVRQYYS